MTTNSLDTLAPKFTVNVFNDRIPSGEDSWSHLGKFDNSQDAIQACKKVVEDFLNSYRGLPNKEALAFEYLNYGPVPCISGVDNLAVFDLYEFLDQRCAALTQ